MKDSLKSTVTRGKTNRSHISTDTDNPTDIEKIRKLFEQYLFNSDEKLFDYIENEVEIFQYRLQNISGIFYRGLNEKYRCKIIGCKIGPPKKPIANRYNDENEQALYLIDNIDFLPREINSNKILLQNYKIPIDELNIADISSENKNIDNNLSIIFDICETGRISDQINIEETLKNSGKSKYLISQKIAGIFKKFGWEGLFIPGVHGDKNQHYHNLCIFYPALKKWEKWTIGNYKECDIQQNINSEET